MESFSTVIVVFGIFAFLIQFATLAFIVMDKDAKDEFRWIWFIIILIVGPIGLIPYWFWGREPQSNYYKKK